MPPIADDGKRTFWQLQLPQPPLFPFFFSVLFVGVQKWRLNPTYAIGKRFQRQ